MPAATLHCPACGAAASDASRCDYCGSRLATLACPSCFGMTFVGAKHCPHCGAAAERTEVRDASPRPCPRCRVEMPVVRVGSAELRECGECGGVWAGAQAFERICAEREEQAAVLGSALPAPRALRREGELGPVRYVPCPECGVLMNRVNFARCSGVVIDVCREHGSWFDRDELRRIVEFIQGGGMSVARERETARLQEERLRLERARLAAGTGGALAPAGAEEEWTRALGAAGGVLRFLLG